MGMTTNTDKKGRKRFTPLEALYYKRIEAVLLLGIHLVTADRGGCAESSVSMLESALRRQFTPQNYRDCRRVLTHSTRELRNIIAVKNSRQLSSLEVLQYRRVESLLLLGVHIAVQRSGGTAHDSVALLGERLGGQSGGRDRLLKQLTATLHEFKDIITLC